MDSSAADAAQAALAAMLDALIKAGVYGPFVTYADVAAACLYVYDWTITLDMEVELVWKSNRSYINVLYLVQRYLPFIDTCFIGMWRQLGILSLRQCKILPYFTGFLYMTGFMLSEMLLSFRVWALWNNNKKLSIGLPILFLFVWAPSFYAMFLYVDSLGYLPALIPDTRGCFTVEAGEQVIGSWSGILVWNTITLTLSLVHGIKSYRLGITPRLASVIYRDGAYYYIFLFIFSALNIVFTMTLQPSKKVIVMSLERILHSVFASRVLLHMRSSASEAAVLGTTSDWGSSSGVGQIASWRRQEIGLETLPKQSSGVQKVSQHQLQSMTKNSRKKSIEDGSAGDGYGYKAKPLGYDMKAFEEA